MRVTSELADLEIELGRITREGDQLVVESAAGSSLDARIRVDASDARSMMGKVLRSGAVWAFLLRLSFARGRRRGAGSGDAVQQPGDNPEWRSRRASIGLNKPW